jgi:amidophosphoribosyltransferase
LFSIIKPNLEYSPIFLAFLTGCIRLNWFTKTNKVQLFYFCATMGMVDESCGVFGIYGPDQPVAQLTFDGLYALQHRGQESAGMAVSDLETITVIKDMGLVSNVFDEFTLKSLEGSIAIGHTRYSTMGTSDWRNAQPTYRPVGKAGFAMAHNGNLTNTDELAELAGMMPGVSSSDSDVLAELISKKCLSADLVDALFQILPKVKGAYSLVLMDESRLIAVRDPAGIRPLCLGRMPQEKDTWVIASESTALDIVGAQYVREIDCGEMIVIDSNGLTSRNLLPDKRLEPKLCVFEFVYFARPDSILFGKEVHGARRRMGELLAMEYPVTADMVMGVPESGVPAAEGYARASNISFGQGLVKNRYIGRTFIDPSQPARERAVRRKLNPLKENISGKRLVVVDDSFVRGTTSKALVKMLRQAGATEVHMRYSSPPFQWPCYYGIDVPSRDELAAANMELDKIAEFIGADTVAFLSLDHLIEAIGVPNTFFCNACLTGNYPVEIPKNQIRHLEIKSR